MSIWIVFDQNLAVIIEPNYYNINKLSNTEQFQLEMSVILAIDSRERYRDNAFYGIRLLRGDVSAAEQGTFSIELINGLSWCTVIKSKRLP